MAEYVEREALIARMRAMPIPKQTGSGYTWLDNCAAGINSAIKEVKTFPAADAAPVVHAKWVWKRGNIWACSMCGAETVADTSTAPPNISQAPELYCYNCGARMDGDS